MRGWQLKVFFRRKIKARRRAPAVNFDVTGFIGPIGRVVIGQVVNAHQHIRQSLIFDLGLFGQMDHLRLLFADQAPQALKFGLITFGLSCANLFAGAVDFGLSCLCLLDAGPAL